MPWVIKMLRIEILADRPADSDVTLFKIPENLEPGDYIVHWAWSGYRDCIDVHVVVDDINQIDRYGELNSSAISYGYV
jgi:hypothetical protein